MARSEAQKAADKRYAAKVIAEKRYERFIVNLPPEEYNQICEKIKTAGMGKAEFLRWAVAQLENKA